MLNLLNYFYYLMNLLNLGPSIKFFHIKNLSHLNFHLYSFQALHFLRLNYKTILSTFINF
jgi:hypothetical protein